MNGTAFPLSIEKIQLKVVSEMAAVKGGEAGSVSFRVMEFLERKK